jgi:hypothetical protein
LGNNNIWAQAEAFFTEDGRSLEMEFWIYFGLLKLLAGNFELSFLTRVYFFAWDL